MCRCLFAVVAGHFFSVAVDAGARFLFCCRCGARQQKTRRGPQRQQKKRAPAATAKKNAPRDDSKKNAPPKRQQKKRAPQGQQKSNDSKQKSLLPAALPPLWVGWWVGGCKCPLGSLRQVCFFFFRIAPRSRNFRPCSYELLLRRRNNIKIRKHQQSWVIT